MLRSEGYSLMEAMIALLISSLISLPFFTLTGACQRGYSDFALVLERDANFWLSPLLLARWIIPAGNNRWGQGWEGVRVQPETVAIKSDIDGPASFPDDELLSDFEDLVLRSSDSNLQVKSGNGSFQPLLKNTGGLRASDAAGTLVSIRLEAMIDRAPLLLTGHGSDTIEFRFFLRNYRHNLFPEESH